MANETIRDKPADALANLVSPGADALELAQILNDASNSVQTPETKNFSDLIERGASATRLAAIMSNLSNGVADIAGYRLADYISPGANTTTMATIINSIKGAGVPRNVDIAGIERVINGEFDTNINGWADVGVVGNPPTWNAGRLAVTYTTGVARARQTLGNILTVGKRYAFMAYASSTLSGSYAVGSGATNSDYLNSSFSASNPAQGAITEFTATTDAGNIAFTVGSAGTAYWDHVSLRELIPTVFNTGKVFEDTFNRAEGPLGIQPDGLLWRFIVPSNAEHVFPYITNNRMTLAKNASGRSAGYPYLDMGDGKAGGFTCDIGWTGTGGAVAMISMEPTGAIPTVADILANSLHIVFKDNAVDISVYNSGILTTEQVAYGAPCVTDGRIYANVGWDLVGNVLTLRLPDGSTIQRTDAKYAQACGSVALAEIFYANPSVGTAEIDRVAVTLK